jgi:cbb3-type cytochrome oxidase subunit 3
MRPAVKHWLFLVFLVLSLAAMIAFVFWQMGKARAP